MEMLLRHAVLLVLALGAFGPLGCGRYREPLYAAPTIVDDRVLVRVNDAHARGDRVRVSAWVVNRSERGISVDRSAIALRLPDGRTLPAHGRARKPLWLMPGEGKTVKVDFRARGEHLDQLTTAYLVVEGGEIQLSRGYPALRSEVSPAAHDEDRGPDENDDAEEHETDEEDRSEAQMSPEAPEVDTWFEP